jgi:hypothetical protein
MLRTDVTGTRPITQTDATTTITSVTSASQEALNRLTLISVGKQFQAQIMSRLNDGSFLVRIADATARMALPDTAKPGETISLTLLASSPRPTFLLGESAGSAESSIATILQDSTATTQVGKATIVTSDLSNATVAEQLPSSANASLSLAGRLVDNLLHAAQLDGASTKILGNSPLLGSPNLNTTTLAQALQNTIEFSGLFYESHLNQWVNGNRSIDSLSREPQARAGNELPSSIFGNIKTDNSLIDMMRALEAAQHGGSALDDSLSQNLTLNNETARLISLQLGALEQHRVTWQGELWPGQPFEWQVSEETPKQESGEPIQSWRSIVRFDMPTLGTITASIHLANGHVQMQIRTGTEAAASKLRANGSKLASALEAAGSPLDSLTVTRNEPA